MVVIRSTNRDLKSVEMLVFANTKKGRQIWSKNFDTIAMTRNKWFFFVLSQKASSRGIVNPPNFGSIQIWTDFEFQEQQSW